MRLSKGLVAGVVAATAVVGGAGVVVSQQGDSPAPKPAASQTSTSVSVPQTADEVIQSILGVTRQVQQASAGGQSLSREQIEALVQQQMTQLNIPVPVK